MHTSCAAIWPYIGHGVLCGMYRSPARKLSVGEDGQQLLFRASSSHEQAWSGAATYTLSWRCCFCSSAAAVRKYNGRPIAVVRLCAPLQIPFALPAVSINERRFRSGQRVIWPQVWGRLLKASCPGHDWGRPQLHSIDKLRYSQ
jgi:hypothetical protein